MKKHIVSIAISVVTIAIAFAISSAVEFDSSIYKGAIRMAAVAMMYLLYSIIALILNMFHAVSETAGSIHNNVQIKSLLGKVDKERCNNIDEDNIMALFTLSPSEILAGEKVTKADKIRNSVNRCAVVLNINLKFAMCKKTGKVYKVLKFISEDKNAYWETEYDELNRCLEMNEANRAKYKRITEENWKNIIK